MNVEISFAELSEYVKTHYGKSLTFEGVSDKELRVVYQPPGGLQVHP